MDRITSGAFAIRNHVVIITTALPADTLNNFLLETKAWAIQATSLRTLDGFDFDYRFARAYSFREDAAAREFAAALVSEAAAAEYAGRQAGEVFEAYCRGIKTGTPRQVSYALALYKKAQAALEAHRLEHQARWHSKIEQGAATAEQFAEALVKANARWAAKLAIPESGRAGDVIEHLKKCGAHSGVWTF